MARVTVTVNGDAQLRAAFNDLKRVSRDAAIQITKAAAVDMTREAKQNATRSVDTGENRDLIHYEVYNNGLTAEIVAAAAYAAYIEYGTNPHFPPVEPLEEWARRHGMPPGTGYAIARHIAEHGTDPKPFMTPAWEKTSTRYWADMRTAYWERIQNTTKK